MTRIALAILLLTTASAAAQTRTYFDSEGTTYSYSVNANGAVLTPMDGGPVLYLGRSCDAYSPLYGSGTWGWANGGFAATFAERRYSFRMQELLPNPGPNCWL